MFLNVEIHKKVRLMYVEILKQEETLGLCFLRLNDRKKNTTNAFSCYKLTSKLCLVYLEVKLQ